MLRERKKAATMHRIQEVAIDLFEEHGFDAVTIEQIAHDAEVSPSTVYRYFGTKENIALRDEHDEQFMAAVGQLLRDHDVFTAIETGLQAISPEHFERDLELTKRRTRLWFEVPSIRAASYLQVDALIEQAVELYGQTPSAELSQEQFRVLTSAVAWALVAAIRGWYEAGMEEPMLDVFERAVATLRRAGTPPAR